MSRDRIRRAVDDPIAAVSGLSAGAVFHKCAFQVNPSHYAGTYRGQASALGEADYARALADKAGELKVTVLAVTDHNHVGGVGAIRSAARERGISVFPGFELTSTEGGACSAFTLRNHRRATESLLNRFLGGFGIVTPEPSSTGPASTDSDFTVTW